MTGTNPKPSRSAQPTSKKAAPIKKAATKTSVAAASKKVAVKTATKPVVTTKAAAAKEKVIAKRSSSIKAPAPLTKLYVLDTNILLHDPFSICKFHEHDLYIPLVTIEELDGKKSGQLDINRNARQATRLLDEIVSQPGHSIESGYPLKEFNGGKATGKLFVQSEVLSQLGGELERKNDNLYLSVLDRLKDKFPTRAVVMVTKDLNLRIKARALGYLVEDYRHDHVVDDADLLYKGIRKLPDDWFDSANVLESWAKGPREYFDVPIPEEGAILNEFWAIKDDLYQVVDKDLEQNTVTLERVVDTTKAPHAVCGILSRNMEQRAALALLTDPDVDLVALLGPAGTGKTLLALAAALQYVVENQADEVLFTRATVAVGDDIGFLPGSEEEKMAPWLGAMADNQEVLLEAVKNDARLSPKISEAIKTKVKVRAITFMRGRTFRRKVLILDEAQNLTPKQMRTLITRAGTDTKIICLGNLAQIDTPYLTETSSGLAYLVERFKDWPHFGALILDSGERSRLANEANIRL